MKRMLDVLHLEETGHVLTAAVRPGEDEGPSAEVLAGPGLFYPMKKGTEVIVAPLPVDKEDVARVSLPFDDGLAQVLFTREAYQVKDGALANGLVGGLGLSFSGGEVTLTGVSSSEETPYVLVGVPAAGGQEVVYAGSVPKNTSSHKDPRTFAADIDFVVAFVKGFLPAVT